MDPKTAQCTAASSRLGTYTLTVDDLDITKPCHAFRFVGVSARVAVSLAADNLRGVAQRLGVSPLALGYTMKETTQ